MLNTVDKDEILLKVIKVVVQKSSLKDASQFIKQIRGEPAKVSGIPNFKICVNQDLSGNIFSINIITRGFVQNMLIITHNLG